MDSQQPIEFLKKGLHVTLGATTSLVEAVQDPLKREENIAQLNLGFEELTQIWEEKGSVTESEARQFIDNVMSTSTGAAPTSSYGSPASGTGSSFDAEVAEELKGLTQHIKDIREALSQPQNIQMD